MRPKSEELLLQAGAKPLNGEVTTLYRSAMMRRPSRLVIRWRRPRRKTSRNANVLGAICENNQLEKSCLNHNHCLEFWRCSAMQTMLENWEHASSALEWQSCGGNAVQSIIALSSGESKYYALLRLSAHALVIKAMLNDWHSGVKCKNHMRCEKSAARGMTARQGLGKLVMLMCASFGNNRV